MPDTLHDLTTAVLSELAALYERDCERPFTTWRAAPLAWELLIGTTTKQLRTDIAKHAHTASRVLIPVLISPAAIIIGPLLTPDGPCFDCWIERLKQANWAEGLHTDALDDEPRISAALIRPTAMIVASLAMDLLYRYLQSHTPAEVTIFYLDDGYLQFSQLIAINACARCSPCRSSPDSTLDLQQVILTLRNSSNAV